MPSFRGQDVATRRPVPAERRGPRAAEGVDRQATGLGEDVRRLGVRRERARRGEERRRDLGFLAVAREPLERMEAVAVDEERGGHGDRPADGQNEAHVTGRVRRDHVRPDQGEARERTEEHRRLRPPPPGDQQCGPVHDAELRERVALRPTADGEVVGAAEERDRAEERDADDDRHPSRGRTTGRRRWRAGRPRDPPRGARGGAGAVRGCRRTRSPPRWRRWRRRRRRPRGGHARSGRSSRHGNPLRDGGARWLMARRPLRGCGPRLSTSSAGPAGTPEDARGAPSPLPEMMLSDAFTSLRTRRPGTPHSGRRGTER